MSYDIRELNDDIIMLVDDYYGCFYFVKGKSDALVIDTGMSLEPLRGIVEQYLGNRYKVVATHGHLDHIGRSGEFDELYMDLDDLYVYQHNFELGDIDDMYNMEGKTLIDVKQIVDLPEYFDLGDRKIYVVKCPGHTSGSVLFVDPKNRVVFCGDAIGSGCSVWMQVDYATTIQKYYDALIHTYYQLILLGVNDTWYFLGGHFGHEFRSKVASYNLLNVHTLEHLITLCKKLLNGTLSYRKIHATQFNTGQPYYCYYHKAEMIFTLDQLK